MYFLHPTKYEIIYDGNQYTCQTGCEQGFSFSYEELASTTTTSHSLRNQLLNTVWTLTFLRDGDDPVQIYFQQLSIQWNGLYYIKEKDIHGFDQYYTKDGKK